MSEQPISFKDAEIALGNVSYKHGWEFELEQRRGSDYREYWLLRLSCPVVDTYDGGYRVAYGRWWEIPYKTRGDVVRTAFMACMTMEEHECRENFKYQGLAVFGPHLDLDLLVQQAEQREHQPEFVTKPLTPA